MAKITIINGDARHYSGKSDLILTDPPYDMPGSELSRILSRYESSHLCLITTLAQLLAFLPHTDKAFAFDFVLDAVAPKQSKSVHQPHYTHQTGVYLKAKGVPSIFNRKRRARSDTFDNKGYWPTVIRAPRENMQTFGLAKNLAAITDILGSFEAQSVIDPFGGLGTTALAALELDIDCLLIEQDPVLCEQARAQLRFLGASTR